MEKVAYKINALLNKAHGNTTEEEAQALIEKAFELASKYNININELEINKQQQKFSKHVYSYNQPFISHEERKTAEIVNKFFFVKVLWHKDKNTGKTTTVFYGTEENCEVATYTFNFLVQTFERLWKQYRSAKKKSGVNVSGGMKIEYVNGLAHSVWHKLNNRYTSIETAVVLVKTELNESYIEQYGKPTVFKSAKGFKEHELAYRDGRLDGNSIELNKAVNGKERAQIE